WIVNWGTADGTAQGDADYQKIGGQVVFSPGQTSKTISVTVYGDTFTEGDETFNVNLSGPQGGISIARGTGVVTIIDDDPTSGTMAFTSRSWGNARDAGADGSFETLTTGGFSPWVAAVTTEADRAIFEFDVSRVVAGQVTSVTFDFGTASWVSNAGPVNIVAYAGDGAVTPADVTRPATLVGSYQPDRLGRPRAAAAVWSSPGPRCGRSWAPRSSSPSAGSRRRPTSTPRSPPPWRPRPTPPPWFST